MQDPPSPPHSSAGASPSGPADGSDQWDRYWAHGFVTSCALAFAANYEGRMRSVWEAFFAELAPGARILDICTGNGAIAIIANEVSRAAGKGFEIHAIDRAQIDPAGTLKIDPALLEGIQFHARTPAERTPFADRSFDAAVGQYALEYTDVPATCREIARILEPGGRCLFVIHHAESIILETGREELRHARLLFGETRLFERARALIERMAGARTAAERLALADDADAEEKRRLLNAAAADATAAIERSPHPEMLRTALGQISRAFRALDEGGGESALAQLAAAEADIRANEERLRDLLEAARDQDGMAGIGSVMTAAGLEPAPFAPLRHEPGRLVGWMLEVVRSG
jgi:ubiquinone/menaquinone biosynthesis C-methylase UbiE